MTSRSLLSVSSTVRRVYSTIRDSQLQVSIYRSQKNLFVLYCLSVGLFYRYPSDRPDGFNFVTTSMAILVTRDSQSVVPNCPLKHGLFVGAAGRTRKFPCRTPSRIHHK
jgi:hypothetical protein